MWGSPWVLPSLGPGLGTEGTARFKLMHRAPELFAWGHRVESPCPWWLSTGQLPAPRGHGMCHVVPPRGRRA